MKTFFEPSKSFRSKQNFPPKIAEHPIDSQCLGSHFMACEQALLLGDIVKSRRARGTRKETRKRGLGERKAFPQPLARLNRRACSQATHYIAGYNWGVGVGAALTKGEGGFSHCLLFPPPPPSFSFSSSFKLSRG